MGDDVQEVRDHDDGPSALVQARHELHDLVLAREVEVVRRLVEDEDLGVGHESARHERPLLLSSREVAERAVGEVPHAAGGERAVDARALSRSRPAERAELAHEAHAHDLLDREREDRVERAPLGRVAAPLRGDDGPLERAQDPEDRAQDRRLPGSIGPQDREEVARLDS